MPATVPTASAPSHISPAVSSVPTAKLHPPGSPPAQVRRGTIAERILAAGPVKLVLVRAPAGFGKSTAMLQARERLEAAGVMTTWLTLDRSDNDVSRFLNSLSAAIAPLALDAAPRGSALDVMDALARDDLPFALFLDDFELLEEAAILGLLREIIEHLPRRGQLVIGSRSLPDLGLGRLRARGQLLEIDAELLRFSLIETGEFLHLRRGVALPNDLVERLHQKTEGWITALWLVSMALERHAVAREFVEQFSGSDRAVADYLAEDVLAHQSAEIRDFLMRTSILRHLSPDICQALLPRSNCGRILQQLESANLFLTPIHGQVGSYRYHSLFADFLRTQLQNEHPDEVMRLHLAASGWYEAEARPVPAIDHAIEGGDYPLAVQLLAQHAEQFLEQGRMRLLDRWLGALPAEHLHTQPLLQTIAVWAQCFTHGPWEAMHQLQIAGLAELEDDEVRAHVNALRPLLLAMLDRHEEAYSVGQINLARLPTAKPFADSVLSNAMAHLFSVMGDAHEAHRLLEAARRTQHGRHSFNRMYAESTEGALDLREGRLRQATARFRMAVSATPHAASYNYTNGNAWAGVMYAGVVYETNQLEEAEHLLNVYLPLARAVGLPDHMIASHRMRARIAFERGDVDATFQLLTELEYLGHERQLARVVASAKIERARMLLLQGNSRASREELDRGDDPALWSRVEGLYLQAHDVDDMIISRLRWEIHFGDAKSALQSATQEIFKAATAMRHQRVLKLRVLRAMAQHRLGNASDAVADARELLVHTSREGFVRLILDEGPLVAPVMRRLQAALTADTQPQDPIFHEYLQRLLDLLGSPAWSDDAGNAVHDVDLLSEPPTRKEVRVLQLLAEGYSNGAMAEKLFVSDSTVRTHLRNINMKLGAQNRTQAVAIARKLGVMH